jgi:NAD+ synthase (glutamine-hydrolysing)
VKIGLAQINPIIGDFAYNRGKILDNARKAKESGCRLVIFPELSISGYPPQDLLERDSFLVDHDKAVLDLVSSLPDIPVLFGCVERRINGQGKKLYNSAVLAKKKEVVFRARKQLLPTYDVFDETRYFSSGVTPPLLTLDGLCLAVTVCEDVWSEEVREYSYDPVADLFRVAAETGQKIDAIINISASPYHHDKEKIRRNIFSAICQKYRTPFLYCNQVGGQDSLLFDGRSLVMDEHGKVVAQAKGFSEDLLIVDTADWHGEFHAPVDVPVISTIYDGLVMGVHDYVRKCGFSSVVLGLSGGIDSALTAAVAVRALGPENVLGVALPSPYSSPESLEDATQLAINLGCRFEVLPIGPLMQGFGESLGHLFQGLTEDLTEQNIQARIRGNLLMALSNKFGHLLLTTGNKSEMAVGYCTLYGDMSGGLAVISDVPKMMVYELAAYVNREGEVIPQRIITKPPSAELKPDQKDQDDLPPYDILDQVLTLHLEQGEGFEKIVGRGFDPTMVADILRRVRLNEYKRKQAPMGLKVTSKAFGFGRRFPNVQNYRN